MLTYTITGDNVSVSGSDRAFIEKRFRGFGRFVDSHSNEDISITASKTTAREREDSFRVEARLKIGTNDFFAIGEAGDLKTAVDAAKEELMRVVTQSKAKRQTLFHRSARKLKGLIKKGFKIKK